MQSCVRHANINKKPSVIANGEAALINLQIVFILLQKTWQELLPSGTGNTF